MLYSQNLAVARGGFKERGPVSSLKFPFGRPKSSVCYCHWGPSTYLLVQLLFVLVDPNLLDGALEKIV